MNIVERKVTVNGVTIYQTQLLKGKEIIKIGFSKKSILEARAEIRRLTGYGIY